MGGSGADSFLCEAVKFIGSLMIAQGQSALPSFSQLFGPTLYDVVTSANTLRTFQLRQQKSELLSEG